MVKVNKSAHELLHVLNKHETFTRVHPCKPPLSRGQIGSVIFFCQSHMESLGTGKSAACCFAAAFHDSLFVLHIRATSH